MTRELYKTVCVCGAEDVFVEETSSCWVLLVLITRTKTLWLLLLVHRRCGRIDDFCQDRIAADCVEDRVLDSGTRLLLWLFAVDRDMAQGPLGPLAAHAAVPGQSPLRHPRGACAIGAFGRAAWLEGS